MADIRPTVGENPWWADWQNYEGVSHNTDGTQKDGSVSESTLALTDVTTANATTSKHGLAPKGDGNSAHFLNGNLGWTTPSGGGGGGFDPGWFNVLDFGATGDGTTDDSAAIQAAIDSIDVNRGGTVYLPQGKYYIATGLTCTTVTGLHLMGEGSPGIDHTVAKGSTQIIVGDGQWGLTLGDFSAEYWRGWRASNLQFFEKNAGMALGGLWQKSGSDSSFYSCEFGNFTAGKGIYLDGSNGSGGTGHYSQYNSFVDCRVGICLTGIHCFQSGGNRFTNCYVNGGVNSVPGTGNLGVKFELGDSNMLIGTLLSGYDTLVEIGNNLYSKMVACRVEDWRTQAVHVLTGSRDAHIQLTGTNNIAGSLGSGVVIDSGATDTRVDSQIISISSSALRVVDNGTRSRFIGFDGYPVGASVLGTVVGKKAVYDASQTLIGYTPVYDNISGISTPIAVKETSTDSASQASISATVPTGGVPVGNLLIVCAGYGLGSTPGTLSVTDSRSNTYTLERQDDMTTGNTPHTAIWSCKVATALQAADTITFTPSSSVNYPFLTVYQVNGQKTSSWRDAATGSHGTGVTPDTGSITTAVDNELVIACFFYATGATVSAVASGWTLLFNSGGSNKRFAVMYKFGVTAGTEDASATLTGSKDWAISAISVEKA